MDAHLLWDRVLAWGPGIIFALAALVLFRPGGSLQEHRMLVETVEHLDQQILDQSQQNKRYETKIDALTSNVTAIETRAREDLGLVYPDDLVIRFTDDPE